MSTLRELVLSFSKRLAAIERICGIVAQDNPNEISTNDINALIGAFPAWATGTEYAVGKIIKYNGKVYKCRTAHTSTVTWEPAATPTLWEVLEPMHDGTASDPIPWSVGMTAFLGKYYSYDGIVYKCIRDDSGSGTALYYTPDNLVGDYFEIV